MLCTKSDVDSPNSFGENVQKLTDDLSGISDLDIQDGNLKINRFLCVTEVVVWRNFEIDRLNSFGENAGKPINDLFDLSDLLTSAT